MAKKLKVPGIHGLGDHRNSTWKEVRARALQGVFPGQDRAVPQAIGGTFGFDITYEFYSGLLIRTESDQ